MGQTAFVTGATGFVGTHLVRALRDEGWTVTALVRDGSSRDSLAGLDVSFAPGDVTDAAALENAVPDGVDAVFHVAASTSTWSREKALQDRVNIGGTENVIAACRRRNAGRLVHTSSQSVWGFPQGTVDERTPWASDGEWINYIHSKRVAESRVKAAVNAGALDAVILNPAHILGPGDRHNWSRIIRLVNTGTLPGIPPGGGAFADVREVARAHIAAFHHGERGANYLLGGEDAGFLEIIQAIGELLGKPVPERASPAWQLRLAGRIAVIRAGLTGRAPDITPEGAAMITHHVHSDSRRARDRLGYRYASPRRLLRDTCDWMRTEGLLA